jgi:hypothetical protein
MMDSRQGAGVDVELGGGLEQPCVGTVSRLTALSEHVPSGLKWPYRFVGARCTLPSPRPHADYTTPAGIRLWAEKPGFKLGDWDGRLRR